MCKLGRTIALITLAPAVMLLQNGYTALMDAADKGHTAIVQLLVTGKADINAQSPVSVRCLWCTVQISTMNSPHALFVRHTVEGCSVLRIISYSV
jgi:hypothetical protein